MKKNRIKIFAVLTILLAFALIACNNGTNPTDTTGVTEKQQENNGEKTENHIHAFSEWKINKNATCSANGEQERICACGEKETLALPMINHIESDWIIDKKASKTEDGKEHIECTMCQTIMDEKTIYATGSIGLAYDINDDGFTYTVTGLGECSDAEIYVPAIINDCKVTAVADKAFANLTNIKKIVLPSTIESIGTRAFYGCIGLTEFAIPKSVETFGTQIFYKCDNLKTIYYRSAYVPTTDNQILNLPHIEKFVFDGDAIPELNNILGNRQYPISIEILGNIECIGEEEFFDCDILQSVVIGDNVTRIEKKAFYGCDNIKSVVVGNKVSDIGNSAFAYCKSLASIVLSDGVLSIGDSAFWYCTSLTSVTIPDSVTNIGVCLFFECSSLVDVSLGNGISKIKDNVLWGVSQGMFSGCTSLEKITISDNLISIDKTALSDCSNLKKVYFNGDISAWLNIDFNNYKSNPMYYANELYINGELVIKIAIPNDVAKIGDHAFRNCSSLESVTISDSVSSIGRYSFYNCTGLTSITIPDSVTSIGVSAFNGCSGLTSITIPDSVTSIGSQALYNCDNLTKITYTGTMSQWNAVHKGDYWIDNHSSYTIHCTDGDITK